MVSSSFKKVLNMKRLTVAFFMLTNFLSAEYLINYQSNQYCIDSYSVIDSTPKIKVVLSRDKTSNILTLDASTIKSGYKYVASSDTCMINNDLLGLTEPEFNNLNAYVGFMVFVLLMIGLFL